MSILWILTFFGTMAISLWAAARVKSAYARGSEVPASSGYTGAEAAAKILDLIKVQSVGDLLHETIYLHPVDFPQCDHWLEYSQECVLNLSISEASNSGLFIDLTSYSFLYFK
jgi:hypothetical protein